ncbi:MAG: leucine--tRNA ligase [Parcubacteria group bacterium]|jgi:leucyl-tRNA synthetase
MKKYNPKLIERKWQEYWKKNPKLYAADEKSKKLKFYCLDMFPYPSGDGLHVGHVESYTASDIYSRYQRMIGKNVLHPMGWDAFGLPAENFAIKTGVHPDKSTHQNIKNFTRQIKSLGLSYDWSREVDTSSPQYYKWTQWFFLFLYKAGLAYRKKAKVNWCESCKTVLANEQVEDGVCERCKNEVIQKDLEQWFFKITDFAEDLIKDLDKIDWPESTKTAQKNWIGKSEGATIKFKTNKNYHLEVFTTRLDTIFGCTYCVVAPEHPLIGNLKSEIKNLKEIEKYIAKARKKTDLQRTELQKEKTGVELKGVKAINPFTNEDVPIFVADYVLSTYGTGAVMAVPAHDERDFEFAKKYKLKIKEVIKSLDKKSSIKNKAYTDNGILIDSEKYSGLSSEKAREEMAAWLEKNKFGKKAITYKLRDWLISRQRYWGAPIPMVHCEKCGWQPVPEKDLPVILPKVKDYRPKGTSPLGTNPDFVNTQCPKCQGAARRELDTMDTFVCSSWYFFRFADPKNKKEFASKAEIKKWLPVDLYIGGAEHVVLHLLYSRFFTKALHKYKYINFNEPFAKLRHQGMIVAEDGRKMSKSLGNVINPDEIVREYGADILRLFEMFMGPLEDSKAWNTKSIIGLKRFLERVWKIEIIEDDKKIKSGKACFALKSGNDLAERQRERAKWEVDYMKRFTEKTIKKVSEDIENLKFNTAISGMMIFVNEIEKFDINKDRFEKFLTLISPFAPHIAEELWQKIGHKKSIFLEKWPKFDPKLVVEKEANIVIQVNGKVRHQVTVSLDAKEDDIKRLAFESEKIKKYIPNVDNIRKIIFVPGRLINFVV